MEHTLQYIKYYSKKSTERQRYTSDRRKTWKVKFKAN